VFKDIIGFPMTQVIWKDSYSIGIDTIDTQHKQLFDIMNKIYVASEEESDLEMIMPLFDQLQDYTKYHFDEEEQFFTTLSESNIEQHKNEHQFFINELEKIKQQSLRIGTISLELLYFLNDWLVNHIQVEDPKYLEQESLAQ
jgi:hemerythrin-like metal-binding protein